MLPTDVGDRGTLHRLDVGGAAQVLARAIPRVESVVMLLVLAVILVNFVVELAYAWIDPRLRKPA